MWAYVKSYTLSVYLVYKSIELHKHGFKTGMVKGAEKHSISYFHRF